MSGFEPASGTFGSGMEYGEFFDLSKLGAVVTKGVADVPWPGNPTPRIAETASGMLNAIGLQNPGIDVFISRDLPYLAKYDTKVIVNVCGHSEEEYLNVVRRLAETDADMLEINISCPNVKEGGIAFGTDPKAVGNVYVSTEDGSLGTKGNVLDAIREHDTGGLSGPAIKPVAVRMVYEASHAVSIPVIGMGGITTGEDAVEFLMAGARAVSVGTANFRDPLASLKVAEGIRDFLVRKQIGDVNDIVGIVS